MNFIEKIIKKQVDDSVHKQFVRFGKGRYECRALLNFSIGKNVKVSSSYEYANDFVILICEIAGKMKVSGTILSKEKLGLENEKIRSGIINYEISKEISSEELKNICERAYFCLLDIEADGVSLKMKKKLPKPGKSDGKVDDKFCRLEADLKYKDKIKKDFFASIPDCKKCKIKYTYEIDGIIFPAGEKDPKKLRLESKRSGKLTRIIEIDKREKKDEFEFEA